MTIKEFQEVIKRLYYARDKQRGVDGNFRWFVEEVGELAKALRSNDRQNLELEFSDCLAWLTSLAVLKGVDLESVVQRYASVCPKCQKSPCSCP